MPRSNALTVAIDGVKRDKEHIMGNAKRIALLAAGLLALGAGVGLAAKGAATGASTTTLQMTSTTKPTSTQETLSEESLKTLIGCLA
jgi:hypothetical protein